MAEDGKPEDRQDSAPEPVVLQVHSTRHVAPTRPKPA